jgi:hypothetical protein
MMNTQSSPSRRRTSSHPIPTSRPETLELRDLLQSNLAALHALLEEHQRMLDAGLRAVDGIRAELRAELRALGDARAPWVKALADTRALLYVALSEIIIGDDEAGLSMEVLHPSE